MQESVRCSSIRKIRPVEAMQMESTSKERMKDFLEGPDALEKFAMSIYIVKEMCQKYPWLKEVAKHSWK